MVVEPETGQGEVGSTAVWKTAALWILTVLLAMFFLFAGWAKLASSSSQVAAFARWGYHTWFLYFVGLAEIAGAFALLVPRLAAIGAAVLGCTMVGAAVTHFAHGELTAVPVPLVLLGLIGIVGYGRRHFLSVLLARIRPSRNSL